MVKISLLPTDKRFSILFQQSAQNLVRMAREFHELVYGWDTVRERINMLSDMERDGDAITHDVMAMVHRSFITPFDREDISLLVRSLDDVADRIYAAANTMYLYKIDRPSDTAKELSDIISQACEAIEKAVSDITGRIDQKKLLKECVEINRLENLGDDSYQRALADLFARSSDAIHIIKWREIYEDMESTIDSAEVVADVLEGIALKYA